MGQRRKHIVQAAFSQDIRPPADNQQIVRALGTRGGNIVEVEYPNGATTLCMMPAKFNRKLWVRRGGFLIIDASPEAEQDAGSRITGTIAAVLYEEHVKQLKKMSGVWPEEFAATAPASAAAAAAASGSPDLPPSGSESGSDSKVDSLEEPQAGSSAAAAAVATEQRQSSSRAAAAGPSGQQESSAAAEAGGGSGAGGEEEEEADEDSDDGMPPLQQINNRRVVHYAASDSDDETDCG